MDAVSLRINQVHLRREPGDLAAHDQVNIEIESVRLQRFAMPLLHFAHLRPDIIDRLVQRLAIR